MNQEVKKLWVKALQSGKYKQIKGNLKTKDGHCCLGVLCELAVKQGEVKEFPRGSETCGNIHLSREVMAWAVLSDANPLVKNTSLAGLNDDGKSFSEIADIIKREL